MKHIVTTLLCATSLFASGQSGTYDADFDGDGKVINNYSSAEDVANKIIPLPDGKILVGGHQTVGGDNDFSIIRYNPDGSVDATFGIGGGVTADVSLSNDQLASMALQPDGKIVCVGTKYDFTTSDIIIMRFTAGGTLDATFGTAGKILINLNGSEEANDVAVQPDGKIVVVGYTDMGISNNSYESIIFRFNEDGTPDNTFSFDGKVIATLSTDIDVLRKVLLQPDGKIVGIGIAFISNVDGVVVRFNSDGTLDNSFGTGGKIIYDFTTAADHFYGGAIQADGKIIACGMGMNMGDYDFIVARYNTDGTFDNTFGNGGYRAIDFGLTEDNCFAATVQSDGKILLVGSHLATGEYDAVCYRMNSDGSPDGNFSSGMPFIITDVIAGNSDNSSSVAMQTDGKIIICGSTVPASSSDYRTYILRILSGLTVGLIEFSPNQTAPILYPNPLQQTETLKYTLAEPGQISITLIDSQGKLVTTFLKNENQAKGDHEIKLALPSTLSPGTYFIQIASPKGKVTIKAVK